MGAWKHVDPPAVTCGSRGAGGRTITQRDRSADAGVAVQTGRHHVDEGQVEDHDDQAGHVDPGGGLAPPPGRRPKVAVTATSVPAWQLGSHAAGHERYLRLAIAALSALPVDAEVVLPAGIDAAALGPASPTVSCGGPAPHDELFDRCSAVVTPAGWGTVGRALVRGLPLVLVPIANDQRYIADRCERLGLGIALDPLHLSEQDLREAIGAVCADASYRAAAEDMAAHFRSARPLASSASLVAALASTPSRAGSPL